MDVAAGWQVAVGASHVVEYIVASDIVSVPRTSRHCAGLLAWRDRLIPVIDFALLLKDGKAMHKEIPPAAIVAYQAAPAQPVRYGALVVLRVPREIWVSDDMAGSLADIPEAFSHFARACFLYEHRTVPILDPRQLFTRPLPSEAREAVASLVQPSGERTMPDVVLAHFPVLTFPALENKERDSRTE
jgi:chemotaxis signal transduction protein